MAKYGKIVLNVGMLQSEEQFSGQKCTACGDCIYGTGFRIVVTTTTERNVLPEFKESDIILCVPCKDALQ
jgi:hypothetical protein